MINKIGLILGIVGLILSITMGVLYYQNKKKTRELIAKGEQELVILEQGAKIREDSISLEVRKRDSAIKSLSAAQQVTKKSLNEALREGRSLAADLRKARVMKDTPSYYSKCDSLTEQIAVLEAESDSYQSNVELLNLSFRKQLADKDTLLKTKDELYGKLREAFNGSTLKINQLNQEKQKLNTQLQKSRRTSRVIALLGAVVAGSVYIASK